LALAASLSGVFAADGNINDNGTSLTPNLNNESFDSQTDKITTELSQNSIITAAKAVDDYVAKNKKLPDSVLISGHIYSMPEFLYLMSKTISNKNIKSDSPIEVKYDIDDPSKPDGTGSKGKIYSYYYTKYADTIIKSIDNTEKAPNYITTAGGNKLQYQSIIFVFAKILSSTKNDLPKYVSVDIKKSTSFNNFMPRYYEISSGCCSVVLHGGNDSFAYGFRRDHSYSVDMHIQKTKLNGKEAIKTYKLTKGYFTHAIVLADGWFVGIGGWDNPNVNKNLEKLGGEIASRGKITNNDMNTALKYLKTIGMGHFVIKNPDGNIGVVLYNKGNIKGTIKTVFKMKKGDFVSVPNGPSYYRKGTYNVKSNSVDAAIYVAGSDKWGVQRRNIIIFDVKKIKNATNVGIWATNDDGKYVGRSSKKYSDNIIYNKTKTKSSSIPIIPNKKYIGKAILK